MSGLKFADRFLIKSNRYQDWDYTTPANYFVTICTLNHNNFFGKIQNEKMVYSNMGLIVKQELLKTPIIRKNINIPEWIIMPNHLHMILKIKYQLPSNENISIGKSGDHNFIIETSNGNVETPRRGVSTTHFNTDDPTINRSGIGLNVETPRRGVSTKNIGVSTKNIGVSTKNIGISTKWKSNSLGSIINQFKSKCTKRINPKINFFSWQPRFFDHIIQDEKEYYAIQQYIRDNIGNWLIDPYHYK